jgi:hypothetical protein
MEELWMELSRARMADLRRSAVAAGRARRAGRGRSRPDRIRAAVPAGRSGSAFCVRAAAAGRS